MPAAITHFLQAQKVFEHLSSQSYFTELNHDAFLWGAQGPDFLYCHRYLPWQHGNSLSEYAMKLHIEKPAKILGVMRDYYNDQCKSELVISYIYGFICHYCLDRAGHPFVNYGTQMLLKQQPNQNEEILHNDIESMLDVIILRYEKGELPVDFNLKSTVPKNEVVQAKMAELYADTLYRLFDFSGGQASLMQATKDCRLIFGLLNDRTTIKKSMIEHFERRKGKRNISCHIRGITEGDEYDYANILNADWQWPMDSDRTSNESFFELYERSINESVELINGFLTSDDLSKLTGDITFV